MGRLGMVAPVDQHSGDDHQIVEDDRIVGPAAVGRQEAVLFAQRAGPDGLAGFAVNALKQSANAQRVNIAGRRITDHAGPGHAGIGHVGQEYVEAVFPENLAGGGIGADYLFALFQRCRVVPGQGVDLAVHHDRSRPRAELVILPNDVFAVRFPALDQAGLVGNPVLMRTSPERPIERVNLGIGRLADVLAPDLRNRCGQQRDRQGGLRQCFELHGNSLVGGGRDRGQDVLNRLRYAGAGRSASIDANPDRPTFGGL